MTQSEIKNIQNELNSKLTNVNLLSTQIKAQINASGHDQVSAQDYIFEAISLLVDTHRLNQKLIINQ